LYAQAYAHWRDLTRTGHWRRRPQHALELLDLLAYEGRRCDGHQGKHRRDLNERAKRLSPVCVPHGESLIPA